MQLYVFAQHKMFFIEYPSPALATAYSHISLTDSFLFVLDRRRRFARPVGRERWYVWLILLGVPWLFYNLVLKLMMDRAREKNDEDPVVQLNGTTPTIGNYISVDFWFFTSTFFPEQSRLCASL